MSWETVRVVMHPSQQKSIPPERDEDRRRSEKDPLRLLKRDLGAGDVRRHHLFRKDKERLRRLEPHADRMRLEAVVSQHGGLVGGDDERAARARQKELKVKPDSARVSGSVRSFSANRSAGLGSGTRTPPASIASTIQTVQPRMARSR
jgi:hypothetical protein